jgi:hypothetical protein
MILRSSLLLRKEHHSTTGNGVMSHLIEIRGGKVVGNDDITDAYLPMGTAVNRPDGFYVASGMDLEGPMDRESAQDRIDHLRRATRVELEEEDRKKQRP